MPTEDTNRALASDDQQTTEPVDDVLGALRQYGRRRMWQAGAMLFHQGDYLEELLVIERGEVGLWDESRSERRFVQLVRAGASIGDLPVLLNEPCLYTAVARSEVVTLGFTRELVGDLVTRDPQICFLWFDLLSRRIKTGYPRNISLGGRSAAERVAQFLLSELRDDGDSAFKLTQAELASATGLSRQRVSQVLGAFERLGVVERGRGQLRVLDPDRLRAMLPR